MRYLHRTVEYYDVCDSEGNPTGERASRARVHAEGLYHRTVHVWMYNRSGILFQRRARGKDSHPGLWDVSAAGHVDLGETPLHAAVREIREELALDVGEDDLCYIRERPINFISNRGRYIDNEICSVYLYSLEAAISNISPDPEEVEELKMVQTGLLRSMVGTETFDSDFVPHGADYYLFIAALVDESFPPNTGDT